MLEEAKKLAEKPSYDMNDLVALVRLLRSEGGCPWDREQTHQTVRNDLIEETYEAVEGIDEDDPDILREELGDLLFQVVFHARIGEEEGAFTLSEITDGICRKMIERHPHVFGEIKVEGVGDVLTNWDAIKQKSKGRQNEVEALAGVSRALPSLMRAKKLAKRARKASLPTPESPLDFDALLASVPEDKRGEWLGSALFALADAAGRNGFEPEQLLGDTCDGMIRTCAGLKQKE